MSGFLGRSRKEKRKIEKKEFSPYIFSYSVTHLRSSGRVGWLGAGGGAVIGAAIGVSTTIATSYANGVSPWTGEKLQGHHSYPKFMGGDPNQKLTDMSTSRHKDLHQELNDYLREQQNDLGYHMRPQRGNSGVQIQNNFDPQVRLNTMKNFYDNNRFRYLDARYDFYRNNNLYWKPW